MSSKFLFKDFLENVLFFLLLFKIVILILCFKHVIDTNTFWKRLLDRNYGNRIIKLPKHISIVFDKSYNQEKDYRYKFLLQYVKDRFRYKKCFTVPKDFYNKYKTIIPFCYITNYSDLDEKELDKLLGSFLTKSIISGEMKIYGEVVSHFNHVSQHMQIY